MLQRKCEGLLALLPPNCLYWVRSSQGHQYRPVSLITSSVCFLSAKTSILGYSRLLKASLLSSSFLLLLLLPPSITSLLFILNPLHVSSPFPPPSLLLQCNLRPCLIDGWMMKVAGGGMVVPCFLLLWWRRFQQTEILPLLLLFLRFFSCYTILCYFLFSSFISRSGSSSFHIHVSKGLFRTKIDQRKSPSTSTIISRGWKLLSITNWLTGL